MARLYLGLISFGAGIVVALLGWAESQEPFAPRKFFASVLRSLVGATIFATTHNMDMTGIPIDAGHVYIALISAPGFDRIVNAIGGALGNAQFPLPKRKVPPG